MIHSDVDLSEFNNIFCDSKEALYWAYENGLSQEAVIWSSSPALLMKGDNRVRHIESKWTMSKIAEFQTTIKKFTEDIYDSVMAINGVSHEIALSVAITLNASQNFIFKASCLNPEDLIEKRLFIAIDSNGGPNGNNMNSPWSQLLRSNPNFKVIKYQIKSNNWGPMSSKGVSWLNRIRIGGYETFIFRLVTSKIGQIYSGFFRKQVLIPRENELVIETAAAFITNGWGVYKIQSGIAKNTNSVDMGQFDVILDAIQTVIGERIRVWVLPDLVETCKKILTHSVRDNLLDYMEYRLKWLESVKKASNKRSVLLSNNVPTMEMVALTEACRECKIPVVFAQHGVTAEISALHGQDSVDYGVNMCDYFLAYNYESKKVEDKSHFRRGSSFVVGISKRHFRMNRKINKPLSNIPIVYVSTNIYKGNIGSLVAWSTDLEISKKELNIVNNILSVLPHKVCYKRYPEENRRYSDTDPALIGVEGSSNISLFEGKKDIRYFIDDYRISITSRATSTLGWLVMSEKPVIFINFEDNAPLTQEAEKDFSAGLFLFNYKDDNFLEKLVFFLSQSIAAIEEQYRQKKDGRQKMIKRYFTSYPPSAGRRAVNIVRQFCFK
jgi:hypothetical protein